MDVDFHLLNAERSFHCIHICGGGAMAAVN
jgi:hypothetical protein